MENKDAMQMVQLSGNESAQERLEIAARNMEAIKALLAESGLDQATIDATLGVNGKARDDRARELREQLKAERAAKREAKRLIYDGSHLYIRAKAVAKNGKEYEKNIPARGVYTDDAVLLTIDGNAYIGVCDNGFEGVENECFVHCYTRCSERSSSYYWQSSRVKECQNLNIEDAKALVDGLAFSELLEKVRNCKAFTPAKAKRTLEVARQVVSKARTLHDAKVRRAERLAAKA